MNKLVLTSVVVLLCSFTTPDEVNVMKAAQENLSASLSKIPDAQLKAFGFESKDEFSKCVVGTPYKVLTFSKDFYESQKLENKNYLEVQNEWRVPVSVNGNYRLLFTVINQNNDFVVADIGGTLLSKELQEKSKISSSSHGILRIYPLSADFLVENSEPITNARFIPLTSAMMSIEFLKNDSQREYSLSEVMKMVKQELNNHPKN